MGWGRRVCLKKNTHFGYSRWDILEIFTEHGLLQEQHLKLQKLNGTESALQRFCQCAPAIVRY